MRFVVVALVALGLAAAPAAADVTVQVTTINDSTAPNDGCSIREALMYAGGVSEHDCSATLPTGTTTIVVPAGCYKLNGTALIAGVANLWPVSIVGAGAGRLPCDGSGTVIDAQQASGVLFVAGGETVSVSHLTLTGGRSSAGGGISMNTDGQLALTDVTVAGNLATAGTDGGTSGPSGTAGGSGGSGGGIELTSATLKVLDSTITGNAAGAGGAGGDGNGGGGGAGGAGGSGGGIYAVGPEAMVQITRSTIAGNAAGAGGTGGVDGAGGQGGAGGAGGDGGGILISGGIGPAYTSVTNSTVTANHAGLGGGGGNGTGGHGTAGATGNGGGIRATDAVSLSFATVAGNTGSGIGDGIDQTGAAGNSTIADSVIAGNGTQNCVGPVTDGGFDVTFPGQAFSDCPGVVGDPLLGPLQDNGGPTVTQLPAVGSAAIDLVPVAGCPAADQRGVARPQGAACDAGAVEAVPPAPPPPTTTPTTTATPTTTTTAPQPPPTASAPVVSAFRQSAGRWADGSALAHSSARRATRPVGTTFSFTLSEDARYALAFARQAAGRRVKGRCVAATTRSRKARSCTRSVSVATLSFAGHQGANAVRFQGRVSRTRKLSTGRYTVTLTATDAGGRRSRPQALSFSVVS
jgi:hypothetical protein